MGSRVQTDAAEPGVTAEGPTVTLRDRLFGVLACAAAVIGSGALVFRYLFQYGVSNIWSNDGASQHFPAFVYFHEWMTALLSGHGAGYGMWSWRLGLGADTLTTLSYYLGDPFALLAIPFPVHMLEYVYEGLFFLRILCAGLAAYYYLRTMKAQRFAAIAGTLVYVFAGFTLIITLRHAYFANALVFFPLILVGVEKILARKRWYLLVGALFVAAASNFYFFYQIAIVAVLYAVVRYVEVMKPGQRLRKLLPEGLRIGSWYALGTVLAAFMLLPLVLAILSSSRESSAYGMPILYRLNTYLSYIVGIASARGGQNSLFGGFAIVGFIAAGVVFLRRGNFALKAMFVAFAVFIAFPFFGRLFNGFAFPSYRFTFTLGLFFATAVAIVLSDARPLSRRELTITGAGLLVYGAVSVWACGRLGYPLLLIAVPLGLGAGTWALLAGERLVFERSGAQIRTVMGRPVRVGVFFRAGVAVLLVGGIAAAGVADYSKSYNTRLTTYLRSGTVLDRYLRDPGALVPSLPIDGLQRVDKQTGALKSDLEVSQNNDPLVQGFAGLDFYYSVMDGGVHEYANGLADRSMRFAFDIEAFDDRAALDTLAGVRYYLAPSRGAQYVPYGFAPVSTLGTATVYENRNTLPVGYVYHSAISSGVYDAMPPLDKQQALLQGIVLADGAASATPRITPPSDSIEVTYTLAADTGMSWDQETRRVSVHTRGSSARLSFAPVRDAELYVEMTGIRFAGTTRLSITVDTGGASKATRLLPPSDNYYWGNRRMLVNLGYFPKGTNSAKLTFGAKTNVTYDSLNIIAVPMGHFDQRIGLLAAEGMRDVRVGTDALSGSVTAHGEGVLFLSIPYSTGWSATVDGVRAPIIRANVGFSGIAVANGTHTVELRYVTPGLVPGTVISVLAVLLAAALAFVTERRLAKRRTNGILARKGED